MLVYEAIRSEQTAHARIPIIVNINSQINAGCSLPTKGTLSIFWCQTGLIHCSPGHQTARVDDDGLGSQLSMGRSSSAGEE